MVTDTLPDLRESLRLTPWELKLGEETGNSETELDAPNPELDAVTTSGNSLQCDECNYIGRTKNAFTNHMKKHRNKVEETGAGQQLAAEGPRPHDWVQEGVRFGELLGLIEYLLHVTNVTP